MGHLVEAVSSEPERAPGRKSGLRRLQVGLMVALALIPVAIAGLWIFVHSVPWAGPLVANSLRAAIGKDNVARLEDFVYAIEDRVNRSTKAGERPRSYWKVPPKAAPATKPSTTPDPAQPASSDSALPAPEKLEPFAPESKGAYPGGYGAEGDGVWVPMIDPRRPDESPRLYKTLLHPDKSRSWAELFVVAVDLRQVEVMPVLGYQEPRTDKPEAEGYVRTAKIPEKHYAALLGAFNGGFMAEHGGYGFFYDGITFLDPKPEGCTLAQFKDGSLDVATWTRIADRATEMSWYRQAPACMIEDGEMHPFLKVHQARKWGATLDGNTVIRRSAVGLSRDKKVLYVGITNHTTAKVLAAGMHHAGAEAVAQMDVNWSYPKFVTYEPDKKGVLHPVALAEGFEFSQNLYLRERSMRDFFYLARKEEVRPPQAVAAEPKPDESAAERLKDPETSGKDAPSPMDRPDGK